MFDKKPKLHTDLLGKTNRIVEATIIKGDISSPSDFRLDGQLIGNFESKGKLVIGLSGNIKGDIICVNCDIEGTFEGKIQVSDTLSLKATAIIHGEVICGKLAVEPGAEFTATCVMKPSIKNQSHHAQSVEEKTAK